MNLEVVNEYPPNYDKVKSVFDIENEKVVFTYDGKLYNPHNLRISPELIEHELVHVKQQAVIGAVAWWDKYLEDKEFRFAQEVEAYGAQYAFVLKLDVPRKAKEKFLYEISTHLSGKIYGGICSYQKAESAIRHHAKNV